LALKKKFIFLRGSTFTVYHCTKFRIPSSSGSLSYQILKKTLHSTRSYLHKSCEFFEGQVPYTISGL